MKLQFHSNNMNDGVNIASSPVTDLHVQLKKLKNLFGRCCNGKAHKIIPRRKDYSCTSENQSFTNDLRGYKMRTKA